MTFRLTYVDDRSLFPRRNHVPRAVYVQGVSRGLTPSDISGRDRIGDNLQTLCFFFYSHLWAKEQFR